MPSDTEEDTVHFTEDNKEIPPTSGGGQQPSNISQNISSSSASNSENMSRPTLNIDRLTHSRPNIPILIGYIDDCWRGPSLNSWFAAIELYFADEGISTDSEKLRAYTRFLSHKEGNVSALILSTPELFQATSWLQFKTDLSLCLDPLNSCLL